MSTTIVVGYTHTAEGDAALDRAIDEAKLRGGRLEVVHSRKEGQDRDVPDIQMYEDVLEAIGQRLDAAGIEHVSHDFIKGNTPSEDIIETARNANAELIVMGLRRRSKTGKYLMGSVLQDVLLGAPCSVLAVYVPHAGDA